MKAKQSTALLEAQTERDRVRAELDTIQAKVEAKGLLRVKEMLESQQPVRVPWQEYPGYDEFDRYPTIAASQPWTNVDDRTGPRYRPFYENENDLRRQRAMVRRIAALNPVGKGILSSLTNYVYGTGFEFTVQPNEKPKAGQPKVESPAVRQLQKFVDEFLESNRVTCGLDREVHDASRVDGDTPLVLYPDDVPRIEMLEPDWITEPANKRPLEQYLGCGHKLSSWWHGVHTFGSNQLRGLNNGLWRDDVYNPQGYHCVFDNTGEEWDYLPASRVVHIKRNVGRRARRGVSDYLVVLEDLESEAKIRKNTATGAAILAAIVMIRQHAEGTTQSTIQSMVASNATSTYTRNYPNGTQTANSQHVPAGTVKDTPAGMTATLGPMGTLRSPVYIDVAQYVLRIIGNPWSMPEYLISGDASNANFASSLVSEAPFVKDREADQEFYAQHWISLIWKAVRMACKCGRLPLNYRQLKGYVKIKAEMPEVASRDKRQQADVLGVLMDKKIVSKRTAASEMGYDYDEELAEIEQEPKEPAPVNPFGMPGQPFGRPSPFGQQGNPQNELSRLRPESRTAFLATRAIDLLMERGAIAQPTNTPV